MIQLAVPAMRPQLQTIWEACFGDSGAYVDFLFDTIVKPDQVLVYTDETGEPVAMLCMQPLWLAAQDGAQCRGVYIFGVATLPRCQGQGVSTALLEGAHLYMAANGASASVLVPADAGLMGFYQKRGYEKAFPLRRATIEAKDIRDAEIPCVLVASALGKLEQLRDRRFGDSRLFARWGRGYLNAVDGECRFSGGEVLRFTCGGEDGYAVCCRRGDHLLIKELTASDRVMGSVLAALHRRFGARGYQLYLRGDRGANFFDSVLPFGVIRWYDIEMKERFVRAGGAPAYLAHVLD